MRIPLIRRGDDETPFAWWEVLFAPIVIPLCFVILLVMAVVSIPVELVYRLRLHRQEKQLRPRLAAAGRFMEWSEVEAKLKAGEGTLIVEHRSPRGPIREWWTEDDLITPAPVPLPASLMPPPEEGQLQPLHDYAKECAARYLDIEAGTATLTAVPVPLGSQFDPRKYVTVDMGGGWMSAVLLVTDRKLSEKYPRAKVMTLLAWFDEPLLFRGDAESVFLSR